MTISRMPHAGYFNGNPSLMIQPRDCYQERTGGGRAEASAARGTTDQGQG